VARDGRASTNSRRGGGHGLTAKQRVTRASAPRGTPSATAAARLVPSTHARVLAGEQTSRNARARSRPELAPQVGGLRDHAVAVDLLDEPAQPLRRVRGLAERHHVERDRHDLLGGGLDPRELADALVAVDAAEAAVADPAERQRRDPGEAHHGVDRGHAGAHQRRDPGRRLSWAPPIRG